MADYQPQKISIVRLSCILSAFMGISFALCLAAGYVLPGLRDLMPLKLIPGFSWTDPLLSAIGFVWSIGFGAYVAILFAILFNALGGVVRHS